LVLNGSAFPVLPGFRCVSSEQIRAGEGEPVRVAHPDPGLRVVFAPEAPVRSAWYQLELRFPPEGLVDVVARFAFAHDRVLWMRLPLVARNHFLAHLRLEGAVEQIALTVNGSGRLTEPALLRFKRVGWPQQIAAAARRGRDIFRRDGSGVVASGLNYLWRRARGITIALSRGSAAAAGETSYETWMRLFDEHPDRDRARHEARLVTMTQRPLISLLTVLPVAEEAWLVFLARNISAQIYPDWELIVAAPAGLHDQLSSTLGQHGIDPAKLRVVNTSGIVADDLNTALAASHGTFVLPLSGLLRPNTLLEFAMTAACAPGAQLIYADNDIIGGPRNRGVWHFKAAWSPELLAAFNYIGDFALMRREAVHALGGWRPEGSDVQHDLLLRLTGEADPRAIVHLAKLVHHATDAPAEPRIFPTPKRTLPEPAPRVSLIIPTRDGAEVLSTCIRSIREKTDYRDYEIIIVDNGSVQEETKRLFAEFARDPAIRIMPYPGAFNFSAINNAAAREATGTIIGLINNDIEATQPEWLTEMVAHAMWPDIGCVGAKLLYPDGRIQHGGVVLGLYGVAGHAHRFARAADPGYLNRLRMVQNVSAVTAACLLVRREVFDTVGGLDETLAVAFNDVDFCLKVRDAGYRNLWTPFAELIHHESASRGSDITPAKAARFAGEYAIMQRRWGEQLLNDPYYSPHLTYDGEDFSLRLR
jgi:GT2 family glycosyltransferase